MRARIPNNLAGSSLLGVHNWIKSQVALSNPGGSPDYKLSDPSGNRITLSDVIKNPGKEVIIEVEAIQGVRKNPTSMAPVMGIEIDYPMVPRTGNHITELLPDEIDHVMAERIVAEQGLRAGLHTINRLMLTRADARITRPTTAALMQMGEIIKKNPIDRTPFTQRTPLIYSPEKALAQWLAENAGIEPENVGTEKYSEVFDHKISARYGLNKQDIEKFARDVLSEFLFAASANRGLVRILIKRGGLQNDRETVHKLLAMFPQQAHQFYNGTQMAFVAHPAFIYPAYAEAILNKKHVTDLINFSKAYPGNMGRNERLPRKIGNLVKLDYEGTYDTITGRFTKRVKAFLLGSEGGTRRDLEAAFKDKMPLEVIAQHLGMDPRAEFKEKTFKPLYYFSDIGGFYPTPPPKWPKALMCAIMDAVLLNLPYIINVSDPSASNLSPVRMAYMSEPTKMIKVEVFGKTEEVSAEAAAKVKDRYVKGGAGKVIESFMRIPDVFRGEGGAAADGSDPATVMHPDVLEFINAINASLMGLIDKPLKGSSELTWDPAGPKSIVEIAYDVAEIATAKYNYNPRGDDFKFIMTMIHYSLEELKKDTKDGGFEITESFFMGGIKEFLGGDKYDKLNKLLADMDASSMDEDLKTGLVQTAFMAKLLAYQEEVTQQLSGVFPDTALKEAVKADRRKEIEELEALLNTKTLSDGLEAAARRVLVELRGATA